MMNAFIKKSKNENIQVDESNYENICPEDYTKLEKILQKHEGEIRNHISVILTNFVFLQLF